MSEQIAEFGEIQGRIKFLFPHGGSGFISYDRSGKGARDADIYFEIKDVVHGDILEKGDDVIFQIDGLGLKDTATKIRLLYTNNDPGEFDDGELFSDSTAYVGRICQWDWKRNFGFIRRKDGGPLEKVYFHQRSIVPDPVGHRCVWFGYRVKFWLKPRDEEGNLAASRVVVLDRPIVDPITHREFSQFTGWAGDHKQLGFLRRRCYEADLAFHISEVTTEGADEIHKGQWVKHGIRRKTYPTFKGAFECFDVEFFQYGFVPPPLEESVPVQLGDIEQTFLSAPELPMDEPAPVASIVVRTPDSPVWVSSERRLSLRELIARGVKTI